MKRSTSVVLTGILVTAMTACSQNYTDDKPRCQVDEDTFDLDCAQDELERQVHEGTQQIPVVPPVQTDANSAQQVRSGGSGFIFMPMFLPGYNNIGGSYYPPRTSYVSRYTGPKTYYRTTGTSGARFTTTFKAPATAKPRPSFSSWSSSRPSVSTSSSSAGKSVSGGFGSTGRSVGVSTSS